MENHNPTVFVSYSHSSEDHKSWVKNLAKQLMKNGVNVVLDQWELREGDNKYAFMQRMVTDESVNKIILVCDKAYRDKADNFEGGVGDEAQIISPQLYDQVQQKKVAAIISERSPTGSAYIPAYYGARIYIDLSSQENIDRNYETLLRWIYDQPAEVKPELGEKPSLQDGSANVDLDIEFLTATYLSKEPYSEGGIDEQKKYVESSSRFTFLSRVFSKWNASLKHDYAAIEIHEEELPALEQYGVEEGYYLPSHLHACEHLFKDFLHDIFRVENNEQDTQLVILNALNFCFSSNVVMHITESESAATSSLFDMDVEELAKNFRKKYGKMFRLNHSVQFKAKISKRDRVRDSIYFPLDNETGVRSGLLVYGTGKGIQYSDNIMVLINAIYSSTSCFREIKPAKLIKSEVFDFLKKKYTYVSDRMYTERLAIFEEDLQQVKVCFEPIIEIIPNIKEMRVWGVEALARTGNTAPASLFKAAELWGVRFQTALDLYILDKSLKSYREHIDARRVENVQFDPCPLSINVYPNTLLIKAYQKALPWALNHYRINGEKIILEISEKALISRGDSEKDGLLEFNKIQRELIQNFNINFAVDDYGTGNSSVSRILKINPEYVKIDREILLYEHDIARQIIRQLVEIENRKGRKAFKVILEGLDEETNGNIPLEDIVYNLKVNYIQGHLFQSYSLPYICSDLPEEKKLCVHQALGWAIQEAS